MRKVSSPYTVLQFGVYDLKSMMTAVFEVFFNRICIVVLCICFIAAHKKTFFRIVCTQLGNQADTFSPHFYQSSITDRILCQNNGIIERKFGDKACFFALVLLQIRVGSSGSEYHNYEIFRVLSTQSRLQI